MIFSPLFRKTTNVAVMGDFNLDLLQYNHHVPTQDFMECLFSHAFLPLISIPTRLTSYSATLIDNIFTNHLSTHIFTDIVLNDLSDYFLIYALFMIKFCRTKVRRNFLSARLKKTIQRNSMNLFDWLKLLNTDDPNESYSIHK